MFTPFLIQTPQVAWSELKGNITMCIENAQRFDTTLY